MDENPRIADLRKKLEKDPGSRLFAQLAEELRKDGKHDEAISVARRGLEKNPNYPSARLTLARALLDAGQPRAARPELEQIVKASPDNILAGRLLGEALEELGEVTQAIQQFERTLVFSPGDKAMTEKVALLGARVASEARVAPTTPAGIAPAQAALGIASIFDEPPPAFPPVFAPAIEVNVHEADVPQALPSIFDDSPPVSPPPVLPPPVVSAAALDRDLASGTISPGSLSVAALQKHFELLAAADTGAPTARVPEVEIAEEVPEIPETLGFGELDPSDVELNTAETASIEADESGFAAPEPEFSAFEPEPHLADPQVAVPADEFPALDADEALSQAPAFEDPDIGSATLPLTSLTLADLYLQQGLKAEATAVLSRVVRDEPENLQARSRFAEVSDELARPTPVEDGVGAEAMPEVIGSVAQVPAPSGPTVPGPPIEPVWVQPLDAQHVEPPNVGFSGAARVSRSEIQMRTIADLKAFQYAVEREAVHQRATEFSIRSE